MVAERNSEENKCAHVRTILLRIFNTRYCLNSWAVVKTFF